MELRHLKYFATVAKTLNFSEAAGRLFVTQGTLSQQIRQFEAEIGAQLFDRYLGLDSRKLNVTVEVNDPELIMDIVQNTSLIAIVSSLAAYYRSNLVAIPLEGGNYSMVGCVHRLKDGYRKRSAEVFLEMLRDTAHIDRISREISSKA